MPWRGRLGPKDCNGRKMSEPPALRLRPSDAAEQAASNSAGRREFDTNNQIIGLD